MLFASSPATNARRQRFDVGQKAYTAHAGAGVATAATVAAAAVGVGSAAAAAAVATVTANPYGGNSSCCLRCCVLHFVHRCTTAAVSLHLFAVQVFI